MTMKRMTTNLRTYNELSRLETFDERFDYLRLYGTVGEETFGFDRVFNQMFYNSQNWIQIRDKVIVRDLGCDLGLEGYDIFDTILVHHMNPITIDDIRNYNINLLDMNSLITTCLNTHNAIHYGFKKFERQPLIVERRPNDTCPWKK